MKTTEERKAQQAKALKQVGALIEQFRLDTHTTFEILNDDTGMHYHTYRKLATGDPKQRSIYMLIAIAELMQRDGSAGHERTERFFASFRSLLGDAFDEY